MIARDWILLVEDNQDDVLLMERALQKQGYDLRLRVARDGVEALELLHGAAVAEAQESLLPSLVLLDINLPRLNGIEVLSKLRQDERTRLLRVVIFSSSDHESDVRLSYESGASSYVRKPIGSDGFQEIVNNIRRYWLELNQPPLPALD